MDLVKRIAKAEELAQNASMDLDERYMIAQFQATLALAEGVAELVEEVRNLRIALKPTSE